MIRFKCPKCGTAFSLPPEKAGQRVACGKCRAKLVVPATAAPPGVAPPAMDDIPPLPDIRNEFPAADSDDQEPARNRVPSRPRPRPGRRTAGSRQRRPARKSASDLTDEALLKRATHPGRDMMILAVLATIGVAFIVAAAVLDRSGDRGSMSALAAALVLLAVGLWFLTDAARKGSPTAITILLTTMGIALAFGILTFIISLASAGGDLDAESLGRTLGGWAIPAIVLAALARDRKILLALQERGLRDQGFGPAKPAGYLCTVGGGLFVCGYIATVSLTVYAAYSVIKTQEAEVKPFVDMIQHEEQEFLTLMNAKDSLATITKRQNALTKVEALEKRLLAIQYDCRNDRLLAIMEKYRAAVEEWKRGVRLTLVPGIDPALVAQALERGDQLRTEAVTEFQKYASGDK